MSTSTAKSKGPVYDPGLCRCCGVLRKCRLLNTEYEFQEVKEVYSDMMMDCFGLLLSYLDGKPTERLICAVCVHRLRDALAFRKQVLQCEEAFIQVRLNEAKDEEQDTKPSHIISQTGAKVEIEVVKNEPPLDTSDPVDLPIDVPLNVPTDVPSEPPVKRPRVQLSTSRRGVVKKTVPMSKMQQIIRERDTSYMIITNILTIVEFSYVCPFKCRHNNLLCYYCGESFTDPQQIRSHTEEQHQAKKFKVSERKTVIKVDISKIDCRLCPAKIATLDEFKRHVSTVHKKPYYFDYQDSILPFRLKLDEWKCAVCDKQFPYFHALNKHMNEHFSNYVCETCGLGFVDIGRFMMHQQRHEDADYPCPQCGKNFKALYNRELHIDRVHKKRGRVYCPKCDEMLMSYHQKLKHLVEVHGEAPLSFPCSMCDKVLDSRRLLTIHKRKDHYKDYRYECQICGQKFFTNFALNNHMPTHTGERNFKCKVCDKSYPRLKTLKEHSRIHTNDRRYRCHVCGQAFIQNCSLKGHMKSQHPEYG
ncbi:hypothetical protein NE865_06897 [Phthorimaea operculella]|nr:hypothetical protein NE865_06897 [Phthorimaea operculella]